KYAKKAQRIIQAIYGKYAVAVHNLFYSLTAAELAKTATLRDRKRYFRIIRKNQKVMRTWAHSCPQNYLHMYYLVKAEFLSVTGDHTQASVYYQQAILSARENGFTQIEALANERVGVYFLRMNNEFVAQSYLNEAHSLYTGWEALAKTDFLQQEHPDFFSPDPGSIRSTIEPTPPPEAAESRNPVLRAKDSITPFVEIPGREESEHAETLKDEFLTTASYELQNPLEGIIGITRTLIDGAKGEIPEPVQSDLSLVVSEARGLSKLVDDILDFSRLKNERIQLRLIPIDLHQVVEVVLFFARSWSRDNGMTYTNSIDVDMPRVSADENRLQQILLNLMAHALRSSSPGILDISARKINEMVAVTVALTPVETSDLGQEQMQAPVASQTGSAAGDQNPIQLYIIKKLVTLHGGRLTVDALDNSGPSFTLTLPVSRQESQTTADPEAVFAPEGSVAPENPLAEVNPTLPPAENSPPGQQTILIVNDEPAGLQYLVNELTLQNYRVQIARDGFEAMERLKEEPPDLVLLDLIMPRMNGFELCRCIRKNHKLSTLPIVMLIDRNRTNDLALGLQCGANDYLTKPFQKEELEIRIRNQLAAQKTTATIKELKYLKKELFLKEENEARLNISQQKLRTILDQVSDPVFFFDAHLRITHLNKKAEDLFGCQRTQLGEKKVSHLLPNIEEKVPDFQNIVRWSDEEFNQWKEHPVALRIHSGNQESFDMHAFISRLESRKGEFSIILSHSSETAPLILPASLGKQKVRERIVTKDTHFREQLVGLMRLSLTYWEAATGKDKFDLAEQSGLWKVQIDQGSLRARTLDKYLDTRQLSKHPRWKDVIKTAHYVLDKCPVLPVMKKELEDQTARVLAFLNRNKIKRPL
ncbi:MAG: response regulator, partial [bacterium]